MLVSHTPLPTRIIHPPKKKFDIGFVIPCYDEGSNVIDTIYSLVVQESIEKHKDRICVFLVVNNSSGRDNRVYKNNQLTSELILASKKVERVLKLSGDKELLRKVIFIFNSKIHITLVDLYTERFAPEVCNVGIARDIGVKSMLPYLKNKNSIICRV